jgi:hypothetical protein
MAIHTTRVSRCGCVWKVTYDDNHVITDVLFVDIYNRAEMGEDLKGHLIEEYTNDPQLLLDDIAKREAGLDPY